MAFSAHISFDIVHSQHTSIHTNQRMCSYVLGIHSIQHIKLQEIIENASICSLVIDSREHVHMVRVKAAEC